MHPTADTTVVMLRQSLGAAGDAGRYASPMSRVSFDKEQMSMRSLLFTVTIFIGIILPTLLPAQIALAQSEKIQSDYLEDKNVTQVMLKGIKIPNNKDNFSIGAAFVFEGKHLSNKPCCVTLLMSSFSKKDRKYEKNHNLALWADGAQLRSGPINYSWDLFGIWLHETMWIDIPYEKFSKLANSKKAKAKLGSFEFEFTQEQLEGLRELESRMMPQKDA
jgi:hypothetical protein